MHYLQLSICKSDSGLLSGKLNQEDKNKNHIKSQYTSVAQSIVILSRLTQLLTGLHCTITSPVAAPPAWIHPTSQGSPDGTLSGSAGVLSWWQDNWESFVPVVGQSKARSPSPWSVWGKQGSAWLVTIHPAAPSCSCAPPAPDGLYNPLALAQEIQPGIF